MSKKKKKDLDAQPNEIENELQEENIYDTEIQIDISFRGYNREQVENYVEALSAEYKRMYEAYKQLEEDYVNQQAELNYYRERAELIGRIVIENEAGTIDSEQEGENFIILQSARNIISGRNLDDATYREESSVLAETPAEEAPAEELNKEENSAVELYDKDDTVEITEEISDKTDVDETPAEISVQDINNEKPEEVADNNEPLKEVAEVTETADEAEKEAPIEKPIAETAEENNDIESGKELFPEEETPEVLEKLKEESAETAKEAPAKESEKEKAEEVILQESFEDIEDINDDFPLLDIIDKMAMDLTIQDIEDEKPEPDKEKKEVSKVVQSEALEKIKKPTSAADEETEKKPVEKAEKVTSTKKEKKDLFNSDWFRDALGEMEEFLKDGDE